MRYMITAIGGGEESLLGFANTLREALGYIAPHNKQALHIWIIGRTIKGLVYEPKRGLLDKIKWSRIEDGIL